MDPLFVWILTISLMFTGGHCVSESMSCSYVNGRTVCESQKSAGNVAGSAASANSGPGGAYQDAAAMTGNSYTGQSASSRTAYGNMPPGSGAWAGGFPFFSGAVPTFGGGSGFANTLSGGVTGTGGSHPDTYVGSTAAGLGGSSGGFVGASAGGFGDNGVFVGGGAFPGFPFTGTGGGIYVGNMDPQAMMGPGFPFSFVFGRR